MNFLDQAKKLASQNAGATNSVLGKLEEAIEAKTGHSYDDKIAQGTKAAQKYLGTDTEAAPATPANDATQSTPAQSTDAQN